MLTPHLGNSFTDGKGGIERMAALMTSAPALDPNKLDQIPALPLGGRVKLNAWDHHVELIKTRTGSDSARDKMPFEVTPFFPRLTRYGSGANPGSPTSTANATSNNELRIFVVAAAGTTKFTSGRDQTRSGGSRPSYFGLAFVHNASNVSGFVASVREIAVKLPASLDEADSRQVG